MAKLVQVSGPPASGKTTGARFLDPTKTIYIDVDGKGLSWKGWNTSYVEGTNYFTVSDSAVVYKYVKSIAEKKPEVNCIVIDTINTMMSNEEIEILKNPSRDQWKDRTRSCTYLIAGISLESIILQSNFEIKVNLNVEK